ncbi:hypothetical protein COL60_05855 [Bacillus pseudomycoides]|uniref:hypothetical protein n=1 Tax=Bacillus pseudomycoides TaxID=64104 RepID=UPI000BF303BA|nr:hypothetical protein [Bacillus pseudomycoides]PFZ12270.1 hypothetical protein COL60_05855 [Bacillus pseudomycoides]
MNFNKKQKRGFRKGITAFKKFSFLLLLFTFFLSACSEETKVSNNQGYSKKSNEKRELTYDEKTLFYAYLRINHVDVMEFKQKAKATGNPIKGIGSCMKDNEADTQWWCSGPNTLKEKQENAGLSGTYHIASYIDKKGQNHVLLVIPSKFTPITHNKTNIYDWKTDYQSEDWERKFDIRSNNALDDLGKKGLDFEKLMKEPNMVDFTQLHGLKWREIKVNKDLTFK